jgi:hypothetical protein
VKRVSIREATTAGQSARGSGLFALVAALLLWSAAGTAEAQITPQAPPQPGALGRPQAQTPAAIRRDEIKRKLMAVRAYRLTEELSLDEATAARVFPLLTRYDQQVEQLTAERLALHQALRKGSTDARVLDDLIRRALANRRATVELEEKRIGELRKVLSAEQTARLLVALPQIERQIKNQIRRSMRRDESGDSPRPFRKRGRKAQDHERLDDVE